MSFTWPPWWRGIASATLRWVDRTLSHFHLGLLGHFLSDRDVLLDESRKSFRRIADGLHRLLFQQLLRFRLLQGLHDFCVELGDDGGWRVGRRQDSVSGDGIEAGITALRNRRHRGRNRRALLAGHPQPRFALGRSRRFALPAICPLSGSSRTRQFDVAAVGIGVAPLQSITSSARASSVGGTVRPSALAVLRFRTSSNLVGCCTGSSPGFSPLRMRST